tara:strand:- start:825 stop:1022 length:198 start_codon:yes stop_codon:yes gene_type:complete
MLPNQSLDGFELLTVKTITLSQLDLGFNPKFCFTISRQDMNVNACFFSREEEKTKSILSKNRWTH